jgi:hypothetical protein
MRKMALLGLMILVFSGGAFAQESWDEPSLSRLRGDYQQVGIVAHVKVKQIKLAVQNIHPLYLLRGEVIEPFKGRLRRGQALEFYLAVEEGFDVNSRLGDWIVFLEESSNTPDKKWGLFAMENSSLPYSRTIVSRLRRVKKTSARMRSQRNRTGRRTGHAIRMPALF